MKGLLIIAAIAIVTLSGHAWTPILLENPSIKAFVLSDDFWPTVFGVLATFACLFCAALAAVLFNPDTLSGRPGSGGHTK